MVKKIEDFIFYLFLFSLPWQTRVILFQTDWYFNEYKAGFLYGTDLLLIILFLLWFWKQKIRFVKAEYLLIIFLFFSGLSLWSASVPKLGIYQFIKLFELIGLYFYASHYIWRRFHFKPAAWSIIAGAIFQSLIAIIQFIKQSSLGLQLTGESVIKSDYSGIAAFYNLYGHKIIRAYGTTPHPNVLAAYLLAVILGLYFYFFQKSLLKNESRLILLAYSVILLGFFVTFSRIVILAWVVSMLAGCGIIWRQRQQRKKIFTILILTFFVSLGFILWRWPDIMNRVKISGQDEAVQLRIYFDKEALKTGTQHINWLGIGLGNFVPWLMAHDPGYQRSFYQPAHNLYLLIYSEVGILSLVALLTFIFLLLKAFRYSLEDQWHGQLWLGILLISFLFIGFFDHFFWTLQQGRLIFWLVIGFAASFAFQKNRLPWNINGKG